MASHVLRMLRTSVVRKQIVALSGMVLVLFIFAHLSGNFMIFAGPNGINDYAAKLKALGPLLYAFRVGMFLAFAVHISFTIWVTYDNWHSRPQRYAVQADRGETNFAKRTMIYTGLLIFFYLLIHLNDFALADWSTKGVVKSASTAESLGLYGVIWNRFANPFGSLFYIALMVVLGFHLSHAIQSFLQTLGLNSERTLPVLRKTALVLAIVVALGYSSIPLYILIRHYTVGIGV